MLYWPANSHPPKITSANLGIATPHFLPRPNGSSQMGATDKWNGLSSPPSLCSVIGPEISGPQNDVSSKSLDQVKAVITLKPPLNRRSTFARIAPYGFLPQALSLRFWSPRILMGRINWLKATCAALPIPPLMPGSLLNGLGTNSSHKSLSSGRPFASKRGARNCRQREKLGLFWFRGQKMQYVLL